jgi:ribonuclease HII
LARALGLALLALAPLAAGCGGGGASAGATVSIYAAAPLCREAGKGAHAGDLVVRVVCLPPVEQGGEADLAAAGADARRATEDSTSVAYLEAPGPAAEFGRTVVESADIAWIETNSAAAAMHRILEALEGDGSSPRQAVLDEVG